MENWYLQTIGTAPWLYGFVCGAAVVFARWLYLDYAAFRDRSE
jgi:hypothetical protein